MAVMTYYGPKGPTKDLPKGPIALPVAGTYPKGLPSPLIRPIGLGHSCIQIGHTNF